MEFEEVSMQSQEIFGEYLGIPEFVVWRLQIQT